MKTFELTDEEVEKVNAWRLEQDEKAGVIKGSIGKEGMGGLLTYSFTPGGIGEVIKVQHSFTKEILDLTDVSKW